MRGESVVLALDHLGVALSSGSACRAGAPEPSHALLAMGLSAEEAHCALRFSLGLGNTEEEIDRTLVLLGEMIRETAARRSLRTLSLVSRDRDENALILFCIQNSKNRGGPLHKEGRPNLTDLKTNSHNTRRRIKGRTCRKGRYSLCMHILH